MAHRSDDVDIVRSDGNPLIDGNSLEKNIFPVNSSGNDSFGGGGGGGGGGGRGGVDDNGVGDGGNGSDLLAFDVGEDDADLPQCKIKRNYSCNLCPFFSQNPRSFLYHSRDVHFDRIKIFECSQCLYASKHSQKLQRHINMIHIAGKSRVRRTTKASSKIEKKDFKSMKPKLVEAEAIDEITEKSFKNKYEDQSTLESLLKNISEDPPSESDSGFKCSLCGFKNKNQKLVKRHEKIVHLKKRFLRCNKCSYVTHVKARYTKHVKYHSMPMIKCDLCDFRTPYKWNLDRHYKNHCGTGAFQCSKCNFRADIKQSLTVHEMNHHVPPVGQGAIMARKKNKVGASDVAAIGQESGATKKDFEYSEVNISRGCKSETEMETECFKIEEEENEKEKEKNEKDDEEKEDEEAEEEEEEGEGGEKEEVDGKSRRRKIKRKREMEKEKIVDDQTTFQNIRNVKVPYINKRESANNNHLQTDFIHPDDIVPRYGQIYVKNLKCKFCSYKAVFSHEIWRHEKRIHGYIRPESKKENTPKRPPPKLIPIQNKSGPVNSAPSSSSPSSSSSSSILKIPAVRKNYGTALSPGGTSPADKCVNENEFNEMCKKSSLTSSLKDFVSLIGDEEGLKTIPDSSRDDLSVDGFCGETIETDTENNDSLVEKKNQSHVNKMKNSSFFDKLKENLLTGSNEEQNLFCELCGHESKCLSESIAHQKRHSDFGFKNNLEGHQDGEIVFSGTELSSTRCQHCRHRCKTSADLFNHLKSCKAFEINNEPQTKSDRPDSRHNFSEDHFGEEDDDKSEGNMKSMENRVFVWNDIGQRLEEEEEREAMALEIQSNEEYDLEVASICGKVTSKGSDNTESGTLVSEIDPCLNLTVKKVFKCPHCSFWASTASRFHVHIVGHLNKKPFECSLCSYRSNWRWDITKHIRLKSARDPSHLEARVNMTDETGRRNYSKYNKYLTMMKVQEPSAESSGTGRRSKPGEATQGNVAERDIIPLPAPPRLTRAPTLCAPQQVPHGVPLRPPPPLKPAHQISTSFSPSTDKTSKENTKKTLWKCKKCNYRDSCKNNVLAHVKKHYGNQNDNLTFPDSNKSFTAKNEPIQESEAEPNTNPKPFVRTPSYKCGHCQQVSNWKHVIQRHCRLKHNGDAFIQVGWKEEQPIQMSFPTTKLTKIEPTGHSTDLISCDICPFTTDTEGDLTAHKLNHVDRPGSIFKCSYCPFYVPSKIAVLEHMEIHGVIEKCDATSLKVDNFDPSECNQNFSASNQKDGGELQKRYKCRQCPYLSNSRTQFLYHKQFHRPRDAPFKCMYCSYNVSRRHLLHQHLRVHHRQKESSQSTRHSGAKVAKSLGAVSKDSAEIPLVWILKSGNFQKMFKCRWCPHVNGRRVNIQEHEKMHKDESDKTGTENAGDSSLKFRCSECSYICTNAGVLRTHMKIHQSFCGEIRCIADPKKTESEQTQELESGIELIEPEIVISEEIDVFNSKERRKKLEKEENEPESNKNSTTTNVDVDSELLSSQPENAYNQSSNEKDNLESNEAAQKVLSFCNKCPARFFFKKELRIHSKFHMNHLPFRCSYCTYTARQRPHLLAHYRVHTEEYQQKTAALMEVYTVSSDSPCPETIILTEESQVIEGRVWTVAASEEVKDAETKHACHRCPAKFFKLIALQNHLTFHGGSHPHKCKYCDYSVKTYGNLIRHQLVHEENNKNDLYNFRIFENELVLKEKNELYKNEEYNYQEKESDSQIEILMLKSSESIYPKCTSNCHIKKKKYKCLKCPSAFEKKDQYRIHLSLHGSKQKYKCEKCDYSVKYYANYAQHVLNHKCYDEINKVRNNKKENSKGANEKDEKEKKYLQNGNQGITTSLKQKLNGFEKKNQHGREGKKVYECHYCPFATIRRHAINSHSRRHYRVSEGKSAFQCSHCDYSASQSNFLRAHSKLHFGQPSRHKAEAYLKCDKIEIWCCEDGNDEDVDGDDEDDGRISRNPHILVFQDRGQETKVRFFPPVHDLFPSDPEENERKTFIDVNTWEKIEDGNDSCKDLSETSRRSSFDPAETFGGDDWEESKTDNVANSKSIEKTRRWRGKNWKCKLCPHAFGKKNQYARHVALHGSNQRHTCTICNYSVKFYTNYVQHMRMHQRHERSRAIDLKDNQKLEENKKNGFRGATFPKIQENKSETANEEDREGDTSHVEGDEEESKQETRIKY